MRGMIDNTRSRFAWVSQRDEEESREFIFDLKSRTSCELPEDTYPLTYPLTPPLQRKDEAFLWPLLRVRNLEESIVFSDERCKIAEFVSFEGSSANTFTLNDNQGAVLLVNDQKGKLSYVDPWRERENLIAKGVGMFSALLKGSGETEPGPQALWLIEKGELRLRNLDGTLRVTLGEKVTAFVQGAFSQLRVAFIAGGNLYEAVAPKFQPRFLQRDACNPRYSGTRLSFASPCADEQFVRIDLTTGEKEEDFEPGVVSENEVRGLSFQEQKNDEGSLDLFVTTPGGTRTQIEPFLTNIQVLDTDNVAGRDPAGQFGVWKLSTRKFEVYLKGVAGISPFVDSRTSSLLWLVLHDAENEIGTLSLLEQSGFEITELATSVPVSGYSVGGGLQQVPEPVLVMLRDAKPSVFNEMGKPVRFRGTLEIRLVSGALPAEIDSQVSSYALVYDPESAGLLYAVDTGGRKGLWFAAL